MDSNDHALTETVIGLAMRVHRGAQSLQFKRKHRRAIVDLADVDFQNPVNPV